MWDLFDVTMQISMIATIIGQFLMVLGKLFDIITGIADFLFPTETPAT
ncbi:MAG TPA: hypothetical protein PKO36_02215 [Candidatus Hydrogenedentes bacterium]|nr:hypothetical protein [Candidatus Hydrogenedentota bacterium]HOV72808.1 hypothetical protein [Candidatus Hydrogenedentota bacterium]HPC16345.1 hypothetical protein [Candidatus Hydrogenedentota bacterium]HRT20278.1 hypothetical protein [Candidatus Hydrogenedentota bacterium]HRT65003.1 hypothetical protein [Candidatus Hydrogenedentota bacterium]